MYQDVRALLSQLETCLKAENLWQSSEIDPALLQSTVPFSVDTLSFEQWLQFVFIPKMAQLVVAREPLPRAIALQPMAHVVWQERYTSVQQVLLEVDALLGDSNG